MPYTSTIHVHTIIMSNRNIELSAICFVYVVDRVELRLLCGNLIIIIVINKVFTSCILSWMLTISRFILHCFFFCFQYHKFLQI